MQFLTYFVFRFSIALTLATIIGYGWLLNIKHLLAVDNLSVLDYPFAILGIVGFPFGAIIGYFGW